MKRGVQVDLDELIEAMEEHDDPEVMHYLDAETGPHRFPTLPADHRPVP